MKWEYKILIGLTGEETFNELGEEGWELVCVDPSTMETFFKRPKK